MNEVIIFGTDLFADVVYYYFTNTKKFLVSGFTAHRKFIKEKEKFGRPIVPYESLEQYFPPNKYKLFIAVGYKKLNRVRSQIFNDTKRKGYSCVSYVYPEVKLWDNVFIGENVFIFEDNTIQPFVKIGDNTVLWSGNHIGHHSIIGNHCFITSQVVISGNCKVGDYTFIGVNATVRDSVQIGKSCLIGAGSLIMKNAADKELFITKRTYPDKRTTDEISI